MAEQDGHDPDRAAIMARRRHFIAVALGGLATGCVPGKPAPVPNTTGDSASDSNGPSTGVEGGSEGGSESDSETGAPAPCLKFDVPLDHDLPREPESESGSDESDSGTEDDGGTTGPRPCLAGSLP